MTDQGNAGNMIGDIPEDVASKARSVADMLGVTPFSDMRTYVEHAARYAILDERERCAKIAAKFWNASEKHGPVALHGYPRAIAAAIRGRQE